MFSSRRISPCVYTSIDPNAYRSCMSLKKPTIRIPDEEATIPDAKGQTLNKEQRLVVESVLSGYNTFLTGPAGSGKSYVLDRIKYWNNNLQVAGWVKKNICITATTGLAAFNIGGMTIHSFAGMGTGEGILDSLISRVMMNKDAKQRWLDCDILVIDEISMMTADFFDKLSSIASRARNSNEPFGGIQIVVCGDFFQLPPVNIEKNNNKFAFEAKIWPKVISTSICLTKVFRQGQDDVFLNILNQARVGELNDDAIEILRRHSEQSGEYSLNKTSVECKNDAVVRLNARALKLLPGDVQIFESVDTAAMNSRDKELLKDCPAPECLELKKDAVVLLLKNLDTSSGLVNGALGIVENFESYSLEQINPDTKRNEKILLPRIRFNSSPDPILIWPAEFPIWKGDKLVACRQQLPLKLGYALTVHRCQGMTIQEVCVNLHDTFVCGQAYVALSRATHLKSLSLKGFDPKHVKADPRVQYFYCLLASVNIQDKSDANVLNGEAHGLTVEQLSLIEKNRREAMTRRSITYGLCPSLANLCISLSQNSVGSVETSSDARGNQDSANFTVINNGFQNLQIICNGNGSVETSQNSHGIQDSVDSTVINDRNQNLQTTVNEYEKDASGIQDSVDYTEISDGNQSLQTTANSNGSVETSKDASGIQDSVDYTEISDDQIRQTTAISNGSVETSKDASGIKDSVDYTEISDEHKNLQGSSPPPNKRKAENTSHDVFQNLQGSSSPSKRKVYYNDTCQK